MKSFFGAPDFRFIPPGTPTPPDRQLEPVCEAIHAAAVELVNQICDHYPEQEDSIKRGVNIRITTADGVDHLFRLAAK